MQMFTRYLERKLWAQKNEDVIDVTLFDEHIRFKKERGRKTFKSVSYNVTNFLVPTSRQSLPE